MLQYDVHLKVVVLNNFDNQRGKCFLFRCVDLTITTIAVHSFSSAKPCLFMYFTRKVWTRRKVKPPLPPIYQWWIRLVLPGMSSEMLPTRASLRTFTAKKKRTPNLERRPSIMHYPIGAASRVDSSYQYPWLAACLRCYLAGRSIVVVVRLFAAFKVQLDQVFRCCPYIHVLLLLSVYTGDRLSLYKAGSWSSPVYGGAWSSPVYGGELLSI